MVSITDFLFSHSFWKQSSGWTDLMPLWQTAKHIFSSAVVLTKPSYCFLLLLSLNSGIFKIPFLLFCWGFCLFVPTPPNVFGSILGTGVFFCSLRCSLAKCVLVLILREQHQTSLMYVELDWVSTMGSLAKISGKYEKGYFKVCKEQWDWRNPLSISDNKNPLKVLQDMKKSLGSGQRLSQVKSLSEGLQIQKLESKLTLISQVLLLKSAVVLHEWKNVVCGWRWPWWLKLSSSFFATTQTLCFSSQVILCWSRICIFWVRFPEKLFVFPLWSQYCNSDRCSWKCELCKGHSLGILQVRVHLSLPHVLGEMLPVCH